MGKTEFVCGREAFCTTCWRGTSTGQNRQCFRPQPAPLADLERSQQTTTHMRGCQLPCSGRAQQRHDIGQLSPVGSGSQSSDDDDDKP